MINQLKLFLFFSIIALTITTLTYKNSAVILTQIIIYYFIYKDIKCKIYGNCILSSWIATIIPIIGIIIVILDYLNIFSEKKKKLNLYYSKIKSLKQ